ncbi:hypothetical protein MASR1M74_29630 [Lentimicrobium sp.]
MKRLTIILIAALLFTPDVFSAGHVYADAADDSLTAKKVNQKRNPNIEFFSYGGYALGFTRYTADYYRIGQAFSFRRGLTSMSAFGAALELKITNDFRYSSDILPSLLFDYRFYPFKTRLVPYIKANVGYMIGNSLDAGAGLGVVLPVRGTKGIVIEALVSTFYFGFMELNYDKQFVSKDASATSVSFNIGYKF